RSHRFGSHSVAGNGRASQERSRENHILALKRLSSFRPLTTTLAFAGFGIAAPLARGISPCARPHSRVCAARSGRGTVLSRSGYRPRMRCRLYLRMLLLISLQLPRGRGESGRSLSWERWRAPRRRQNDRLLVVRHLLTKDKEPRFVAHD